MKENLYHRNSSLLPSGLGRLIITIAFLFIPVMLVLGGLAVASVH